MKRTDLLHTVAAVLALGASGAAASLATSGPASLATTTPAAGSPAILVDAAGHAVPLRRYERVLSASVVSDRLLVDLAEPSRVVAFSVYGAAAPFGYRLAGKPTVGALDDVESILRLHPDLVLVHAVGASAAAARLREAGIEVFDLGEMRGAATLEDDIVSVATLLGRPDEGRRQAAALARRLAHVAPPTDQKGLYVAVYGDRMFGGSTGTSFHDVLVHAGLADAAEPRYRDWPPYTAEDILALAPEVLVTKEGMAGQLCRTSGLEILSACTNGRVIELPGPLLDDPGPGLLDAAEALADALARLPGPGR